LSKLENTDARSVTTGRGMFEGLAVSRLEERRPS